MIELTYTSHALTPFAATLATTVRPSPGTRTAARRCAPSSTPFTPALTGSRATNCATSSTPPRSAAPITPRRSFRVLKNNEKARYGEYRTARLVLEAWDRQNKTSDAA